MVVWQEKLMENDRRNLSVIFLFGSFEEENNKKRLSFWFSFGGERRKMKWRKTYFLFFSPLCVLYNKFQIRSLHTAHTEERRVWLVTLFKFALDNFPKFCAKLIASLQLVAQTHTRK